MPPTPRPPLTPECLRRLSVADSMHRGFVWLYHKRRIASSDLTQTALEVISLLSPLNFAITGGLAAIRYHNKRYTHDVDVLVSSSQSSQAATLLSSRFEQTSPSRWSAGEGVDIDLVTENTGRGMPASLVQLALDNKDADSFVTPAYNIAMKLYRATNIDQEDIKTLLTENSPDSLLSEINLLPIGRPQRYLLQRLSDEIGADTSRITASLRSSAILAASSVLKRIAHKLNLFVQS